MMSIEEIGRERSRLVDEALSWLGTPFHHGAAIKRAGVDCAQLVIASFVAAGLVDRPEIEAYPTDWFLHSDSNRLEEWVSRYCRPAALPPKPGDVALFRYGRSISHAAIVIDPVTVVHSFRELGVVLGSLEPTHDLAPRLAGIWTLARWATTESR